MLEKLAPSLLAGVPAIVKPATATSYVTEACVRLIIQSDILPKGALQLVSGSVGDLLDLLTSQDVVSFTGSAQTALKLRSNPNILQNATRFIAVKRLNLIFLSRVTREMTAKAGQKCTAIRHVFVHEALLIRSKRKFP